MFRVLFLQRLYGLCDAQIEYHIKDRTSFRDFLGIQSVDDVPDGKTVWKYKDALAQSGTYDSLFKRFNEYLDSIGLIVNEGKIVDASFVIAPRQRNTRDENKKIKEGKGDELWNDNPHKKCHNVAQSESNGNLFLLPSQSNVIEDKDIDARWVKKRGERFYGYKDNVEICNKTKLIRNYTVCSASRHDSKETEHVHLAELAATTQLFLVAVHGFGTLGDGLAVGDVGGGEVDGQLVLVLEVPLHGVEVELTLAAKDDLAQLAAVLEREAAVVGHEILQRSFGGSSVMLR